MSFERIKMHTKRPLSCLNSVHLMRLLSYKCGAEEALTCYKSHSRVNMSRRVPSIRP